MHPDEEIANGALTERGQTITLEPEHRAGLRARRNADPLATVRGRDLELAAKRRLRERERQIVNEIVALTLEPLVISDVEHHEQIAVGSVPRAGRSLSPKRHVVVGRDAGGDLDRHRPVTAHPPVTAAHLAWFRDDLAFAGAGGARGDRDELAEHASRGPAHVAAAAAGG